MNDMKDTKNRSTTASENQSPGPEREIEVTDDETSPWNRTIREIFDRDKVAAVDIAERLTEMIAEIDRNGWFGDDAATDDNRPMRELRLARQLCEALENIECIKLIIAKESWT